MPAPYAYRIGGFTLAAGMPLPDLAPLVAGADPADISIVRGAVPLALPDPTVDGPVLQADAAGRWLYRIPDGPRFLIEAGGRVTFDSPLPDDAPDHPTFLLGPVLGLLAHRLGRLPLHAATLAINGRGVAIAGASGAGKSTLAAALLRRGAVLVADDISILDPGAAPARVAPGAGRLKLWRETLTALDLPALRRIRHAPVEKFLHPAPVVADAVPLAAIYHVQVDRQTTISAQIAPLRGFNALGALRDNVYRWHAAQRLGFAARIFTAAGAIAGQVPQFTLIRADGFSRLEALADAVLEHAGSCP